MRKTFATVVVCLTLIVGAPRPAHALFGIDFMEWLNDMSGPGPFHVIGVEATVACWGRLTSLDKQTVRALAGTRIGPLDSNRDLYPTLSVLGLEVDRPIIYFKPTGDIATKDPDKFKPRRFSLLKSIATGSLAMACNQPNSDDRTLVVDLHKPVIMTGVSFDYLFTQFNHLEYEGKPQGYNNPNVHAVLLLGTVDVDFKRFLSVGVGNGVLRFNGGNTYESNSHYALQFRFGVRPLKHLDHGAPAPNLADQITHAGVAPPGVVVPDPNRPGSDSGNPLVEDVPFQGALKKLSTLRFIFGYTIVPNANLNAAKFGAEPSSWTGNRTEHVITAHFTLDLSRVKTWNTKRIAVADPTAPTGQRVQAIGERAIY